MPPVAAAIGAIGAAIAAELAAVTLGSILTSLAVSLVLGFVQRALTPRPPRLNSQFSNNIESRGITRQVRQPITSHRIVYGEQRVSGPITFVESTSDNKFFHLVIVLAAHEVEDIGEVWLDNYPITPEMMDANGLVNDGRYDGLVRIRKHLGNPDQMADSLLISETSATSDYRGRGMAYIYVRLEFDRDIFPGGIPNISAWIRGRKLSDVREADSAGVATPRFSSNIALMAYDYLDNDKYGLGNIQGEISDAFAAAAANICDEFVAVQQETVTATAIETTLNTVSVSDERLRFQRGDRVIVLDTAPGGLFNDVDYYVIPYQRIRSEDTVVRFQLAASLEDAEAGIAVDITSGAGGFRVRKTAEPRYHGGGVIDTTVDPDVNLTDIISGMAGRVVYSGGEWRILPGAYVAPTISLNEGHVVGEISVDTKLSRTDRFNTVKGVYVSPINDGNPSDFPSVSNPLYVTQDNGQIIREMDLPFTPRASTAQRIAKIELEKMRQEMAFSAPFNLHAMQLRAGDNVLITNAKFGWVDKPFEITQWNCGVSDGGSGQRPVINMGLRETATSVYDWDLGEQVLVDPAPNTTLPNPFIVEVVTGFSLDSVIVQTQGGDNTFKVVASWMLHPNQFVIEGGFYEIEVRKSTDVAWSSVGQFDGTVTQAEIPQLELDTLYDVRIFAYNNIGVRSQPTLIEDFMVGNSASSDTEDWENELLPRDGSDWETDSEASEDWES